MKIHDLMIHISIVEIMYFSARVCRSSNRAKGRRVLTGHPPILLGFNLEKGVTGIPQPCLRQRAPLLASAPAKHGVWCGSLSMKVMQ